jgi:spermidine synthase
MGASGLIAQLLLLRELLITFLSNELTIGIILANWLILEAAGSWLGRFIERARKKLLLFVTVTGVFSLCLPVAVYFARTWKGVAGSGPGEGMGLHQIFLASFLILLPLCLTHGALFTFACRLMTGPSRRDAAGIGKVYFLEAVGTLVGGLIFTYLMITLMNSIEAALVVMLVNIVFCLLLLHHSQKTVNGFGDLKRAIRLPRSITMGVSFLLLTITALVLFELLAPRIHWLSIRKQWQGQEVIHYQNSVYGNTAVIEREGEYTFFSNGIPAITAPTPDVVLVEEFAHLPLLLHPRPEKILVISGGAGGVINELLKHPVERIDYVELDPLILKLIRKFPTELTEAELTDPRVRVHHRDGRLFLKETSDLYDVVLIGLSNPQDLQLNRFFTRQFFSLAGMKLEKTGVVALTLPGSLTYVGKELKDLNACILNALRNVFSNVRVIPADGYNLVLASPLLDLSSCNTGCLQERYAEAALTTRYLNPFHIGYRLDPRWSKWFSDSMSGATDKRNEDFTPLGVFFSLTHWNAQFAPGLQKILTYGGKINLAFLVGMVGLLIIGFTFLVKRSREPSSVSIPLAIATTGMAGMILELALIFTFQALYGVVFYWIGLLITAFMVGTAIGSLAMTRYMERIRSNVICFLWIEASLVVFSIVVPLIFLGLVSYLERPGLTVMIRILFLILSMLAGLLIGLEFPLAGKIFLGLSRDVGGTAGLLYGADLVGGWAGGIVGSVVLLPVIGLVETCLFLGILKLASFAVVVAGDRKVQREETVIGD